jgi:hypothetical protein
MASPCSPCFAVDEFDEASDVRAQVEVGEQECSVKDIRPILIVSLESVNELGSPGTPAGSWSACASSIVTRQRSVSESVFWNAGMPVMRMPLVIGCA